MASNWTVPGVNLGLELGPLFLSHCFNWGLFGFLTLQVYIYYVSFANDPLNHKVLVYSVYFLDAISMACATHSGYWVLVSNWGNAEILHRLGWSWASVPASIGLLALIVQTFYAYRIWRVSQKKNWFVPVLIIIVSVVSCGFAFASANQVAKLQSFTYIRLFIPSLWLSFGIAADFFVCATLIYYFTITRVGFTLTNRLMIRLVLIAVETAIVTIIAASFKMYLIFSRRDNMHLLFCLLLPRLYTNALMGSLNSRSSMFGGNEGQESRGRANFRVSNPSSVFGSFFERKKSSDVSRSCKMDADIESGQVLRYQPAQNSDALSPPPVMYSPSTSVQSPWDKNPPHSFTSRTLECEDFGSGFLRN